MRMAFRGPVSGLIVASAVVAVAACNADSITTVSGARSHIALLRGEAIRLQLQNIGPGTYSDPPAISSGVVRYEGTVPADVNVPAGATQIFQFRGMAPGTAIVTFTHSGGITDVAPVVDTIVVR